MKTECTTLLLLTMSAFCLPPLGGRYKQVPLYLNWWCESSLRHFVRCQLKNEYIWDWCIMEFVRLAYSTPFQHYSDIMISTMASQITSLTSVYSTVYSCVHQRKHQSSASMASVRGIHRDRLIPRTKGQTRGKMFPFDDAIMNNLCKHRRRLSSQPKLQWGLGNGLLHETCGDYVPPAYVPPTIQHMWWLYPSMNRQNFLKASMHRICLPTPKHQKQTGFEVLIALCSGYDIKNSHHHQSSSNIADLIDEMSFDPRCQPRYET